jgi:hypothetical protein
MGTQSQGSSHSNQPATASGGIAVMPSGIPSMPVSIAPSALAEHLDDGWGDEPDDDRDSDAEASAPHASPSIRGAAAALVPARVPTFGSPQLPDTESRAATAANTDVAAKAAAKASSALARASSAIAAAKARKAAGISANATLTGGFFALPRASTAPQVSRTDASNAEAPKPAVSVDRSPVSAADAPATVATTETMDASAPKPDRDVASLQSPLANAKSVSKPASVPPPVGDDDSEWDVPSTKSLAAASIAPTSLATSQPPARQVQRPVTADSVEVAHAEDLKAAKVAVTSEPSRAVERTSKYGAVKSASPAERSSTPARASVKPAAKAATSTGPSAQSVRPVAKAAPSTGRRSTPPSSTAVAAVTSPIAPADRQPKSPPVSSDAVDTSAVLKATAKRASESEGPRAPASATAPEATPTIDITIEPSFPQGAVDADAPILGTPVRAPRSEIGAPAMAATTPADRKSYPRLVEPATSMSPVTTTPNTLAKSKLWFVAAAALIVVGIAWGIAGPNRSSKANLRRGQTEPVAALAVQKPQEAVVATPPASPSPEPIATQAAPEPPATATVEAAAPPPPHETSAAEPAEQRKARRRVPVAAAAVAPAPATLTEPPSLPAQAAATQGQSSPSLNAPISPTGGIVDPRAFPSGDSAATVSKVRVEVDPPDSRVAVRGKVATAPYVFDVPKGTRIVLEVAHAGYITRRIVLDGSREYVKVGMILEPKQQDTTDEPAPTPAAPSDP